VVGGAACPGYRRGPPPGVTVFANATINKTTVNRKKKYSDFGKMKCSKFGNKSAVFSGTILQ